MIEKEHDLTPKDEIDNNSENFDTNDELLNSLENLLKNKNKEFEKDKVKKNNYQSLMDSRHSWIPSAISIKQQKI